MWDSEHVCSVCCVFSTTLGWDLRGNGQISICLLHLQKKKKKSPSCDSNICFSHLSLAPPPSLLLYPSGICGWPGHQESQGLREEQGGAGGKRKKRGARERKRKREQAPLTSYFPSTTPACQPACSLFSFELSILPQHRKKKKKSIHISIIHTSVCLHVYAPLLPPVPLLLSLGLPLSLSLPLPLPWGRLTPPPRSYGLQMSLRWATITA